MKKILIASLAMILAISLVLAAGGGSGGSSNSDQDTQQTEPIDQDLCSEKSTIKERVSCRLDRIKQGKSTEFDPEECRSVSQEKKASCLQTYQAANSCWSERTNQQRFNCIGSYLKMTSVKEEKQKCLQLEEMEKTQCIDKLKENAFTLIKFRFYNLENKAEYFLKEGASQETDIEFITSIETKKQEFNQAATIEGKKQIVQEVISLWKDFTDKIEV